MKKNFLVYSLIVLLSFVPAAAYAAAAVQGSAAAPAPAAVSGTAKPAAAKKPMTPPEKAEAFFDAGTELFKKSDYANAAKYFYAAIKIQPDNMKAWKQLGFCYYQLKSHKYAYAAFNKVLEADPNDKDAKEFMAFYSNVIDENKKKTEKREMFSSIWRAAVMPGWGQIHNEEIIKGLGIGGAFLVSLGLGIYSINDQRQKVDKYLTTNENHDIAYRQADDASKAAFIWTALAIGIYAGGIIDAAINYNAPAGRQAYIDFNGKEVLACVKAEW